MNAVESFSTLPLRNVIPSYLYDEYSDDADLQSMIQAFNDLSQGYLDWFNETPIAVYTSPYVSGLLLDWVGNGLYGIPRPEIIQSGAPSLGPWDSYAWGQLAWNGYIQGVAGNAAAVNDDIYKRALTWALYAGNGKQMSIHWMKKRVARFLFGVNGSDIDVGLMNSVSISQLEGLLPGGINAAAINTFAVNEPPGDVAQTRPGGITISVANTLFSQIFQALFAQGTLAAPFQANLQVVFNGDLLDANGNPFILDTSTLG
jgi:hypothetical protein